MTKFTARSITDLHSDEANASRLARKARFVVAVEADDGSWFELDADDINHAAVLARNMVNKMNARSASCWRVFQTTGEHWTHSFYNYQLLGSVK